MKYEVTHSCNHTETHELVGPGAERERKLKWLASTVCSECYKAQKLNAAQSAAQSAGVQLPKLEGSDKQTAWAEDIRSRWIDEMTTAFAQGATTEQARRIAVRLAALVTTAREWIDSRGDSKAILRVRRSEYEAIVKEETQS
ncbi:MAG: hypothetical protein LDL55_03745 [Armatimonadetes bacterium]|nr:hypothetical protein [Armatimonadota bacterium]